MTMQFQIINKKKHTARICSYYLYRAFYRFFKSDG